MSPSQQQASVFNALGSYADRIKDANGNFIKSSPPSSSSATPEPPSLSSSTSGKKVSSAVTPKSSQQKQISSPQQGTFATEDGELWETVQSTRVRHRSDRFEEKEKEKRGSSSKNWRDRSHRDEKNQDDGEKRSGREKSKKEKGDKSTSAPLAGSATSGEKATKSLPSSTKNAWGVTSSSQSAGSIAANPPHKQKAQNDSTSRSSSAAAPVGPTTSSTDETVKQPEGSDEDNWRARPAKADKNEKTEESASTIQAQPQPQRQLAPPVVNVWDLRKKMSVPALSSPTNATSTAAITPPKSDKEKKITNGVVKEEGTGTAKSLSKKKSSAAAVALGTPSVLPSIHDATLWPDITRAAEAAKAGEDKKEKTKERLNGESATVAEESTFGTSSKFSIPLRCPWSKY